MTLSTLLQEKLDLSPRVDAAYKEVFNYQDLLLMADLANINPGTKLANFKLKLPGGKMRAKSRPEVVAYLALIQVCRQPDYG